MYNNERPKDNRKGFNNKGGHDKKPVKKFIPNPKLDVPMYLGGNVGKYQYDLEDLVTLLKSIPWEKISYPIMAARKIIFDDDTKKGNTQIGYIESLEFVDAYDDEANMDYTDVIFHIAIYPKNEEKIKGIEDPIMFPRLKLTRNGDAIDHIIDFEIMTSSIPDDEWDKIR
ncbi:MAG: hypothetical protein J6Y02_14565 [Pseudobutyrivibrio sp.]|nr:hypothetical protein [Pseudobutyrivibrio sp.]